MWVFSFSLLSSSLLFLSFNFNFLKDFFNFLFSERGEGREGGREGEKHQCVVASCTPPAGDLACNPGMCPGRPALNPLRHTGQGSFNF